MSDKTYKRLRLSFEGEQQTMQYTAKNGLSINDIQQILLEDQRLFHKTVTQLKRRSPITTLDATQLQHYTVNHVIAKGLQRLFG